MRFLNILVGSISGLGAGALTGVLPGIHMNLIATLVVLNASMVAAKSSIFIPFLIALSVSYCFFEYIPAIFLSAPEDSSALLVKPTHKFVSQGRGLEALKIILKSSLFSVPIFLLLLPLLFYLLPLSYETLGNYAWVFLLAISLHFILREKKPEKIAWSSLVFLLSGLLGWLVLESYASFKLMPLLTGLFGVPFLIKTLKNDADVPNQMKNVVVGLDKKDFFIGGLFGSFATFLLGIFPGLGPAQASMLANEFRENRGIRQFLISMGAINVNDILFSILALITIGKPRAGTIATIKNLFGFSKTYFFVSIPVVILVSILAYFLALRMGKAFANKVNILNNRKSILIILTFLLSISFFLEGFYGVLILLAGSLIGYLALEKKVKSSHAMAALIVPVVIYLI